MSPLDPWEGCGHCSARSGLERVGEGRWQWWRCVDVAACEERAARQRERRRVRGSVLYVFERPCADPPAGACVWCGEPIVLVDASDFRRARRTVHYGDEHETGEQTCRAERNRSAVWSARDALRNLARHEGRAALGCVDCGVVVEELRGKLWVAVDGAPLWEADHEVALEDYGEHVMGNLRVRCVPCHRAKTGRENAARARARAADTATLRLDGLGCS